MKYPYLNITLDTSEYYVRERDPDDEWDIGERGADLLSVSARIESSSYKGDLDPFPYKVGDTVYVLIEKYSDGCTFGDAEYFKDHGAFFTYEEAEARGDALGEPDHGYFGAHIAFFIECVVVQ